MAIETMLADRAAEAAVCGAMIQRAACIPSVLQVISAEDIAHDDLGAVFGAVLRVWHAHGGSVDGVLVRSDLESRGLLDKIGGADFLRQVVESTPTAATATYYADRVAERARYRACFQAVERMRARLG